MKDPSKPTDKRYTEDQLNYFRDRYRRETMAQKLTVEGRQNFYNWDQFLRDYYKQWKHHSPYFEPEEIYDPDSLRTYASKLDLRGLKLVNEFREFSGVPILLNTYLWGGRRKHAGTRTVPQQRELIRRGKSQAIESFHIQGKAFDLATTTINVDQLYEAVLDFANESRTWRGISRYHWGVHVDIRWSPKELVIFDGRR